MVAQAIRCECFSRVTKSGFLVAHIVDISQLISILFIFHEPFIFVKPLNEFFFFQTEKTQMKCFILSGYLLSVKVNYLQTKEYNIFLKITTCQQPDIYNGLTQVYCIKSEGRLHYYKKG